MHSLYQRILLIEDDEDDQELFSEAIKNYSSLTLNIASNGIEAIEAINDNPPPDIIFLDLNMPLMGGMEFIKTVRETNVYKGPIVILTTSDTEEDMQECKNLGSGDFFTKPDSFSELRRMVSSVLSRD